MPTTPKAHQSALAKTLEVIRDTELEKKYLFKIVGIEFTVYRIVMTLIFIGLSVWGVKGYFYRQNLLEDSSYAQAKVSYLLNSTGIRVSLNPIVIYKFNVGGQEYKGRQGAADGFSPKIGDCIIVKYSIDNPKVSEMSMSDGIVTCD